MVCTMSLFIKETLGTEVSEGKHPDSGLSYMNYFHLPSRWKKDDVSDRSHYLK